MLLWKTALQTFRQTNLIIVIFCIFLKLSIQFNLLQRQKVQFCMTKKWYQPDFAIFSSWKLKKKSFVFLNCKFFTWKSRLNKNFILAFSKKFSNWSKFYQNNLPDFREKNVKQCWTLLKQLRPTQAISRKKFNILAVRIKTLLPIRNYNNVWQI